MVLNVVGNKGSTSAIPLSRETVDSHLPFDRRFRYHLLPPFSVFPRRPQSKKNGYPSFHTASRLWAEANAHFRQRRL